MSIYQHVINFVGSCVGSCWWWKKSSSIGISSYLSSFFVVLCRCCCSQCIYPCTVAVFNGKFFFTNSSERPGHVRKLFFFIAFNHVDFTGKKHTTCKCATNSLCVWFFFDITLTFWNCGRVLTLVNTSLSTFNCYCIRAFSLYFEMVSTSLKLFLIVGNFFCYFAIVEIEALLIVVFLQYKDAWECGMIAFFLFDFLLVQAEYPKVHLLNYSIPPFLFYHVLLLWAFSYANQ